jgi:hypothetical protein
MCSNLSHGQSHEAKLTQANAKDREREPAPIITETTNGNVASERRCDELKHKTDTKRQPGTVLDGWNHTTTRRGEEEEDDCYVHLDDH